MNIQQKLFKTLMKCSITVVTITSQSVSTTLALNVLTTIIVCFNITILQNVMPQGAFKRGYTE